MSYTSLLRHGLYLALAMTVFGCSGETISSDVGGGHTMTLLGGVPDPSEARNGSAAPGIFAANGNEFDPLLAQNAVATAISAVRFEPQRSEPLAFSEVAWAIYRIDANSYDRGDSLSVIWSVPPIPGSAWFAVADFDSNRWVWGAANPDERYSVTVADHTAPNGIFLVAVAVVGSDTPVLSRISLGNAGNWVRSWGGAEYEDATKLFIDDADNIVAAGETQSFDSPEFAQTLLVKWRADSHLEWAASYGPNDRNMNLIDAALAPTGEVYALSTVFDPLDETESDIVVAKFAANGALLWRKQLVSAGTDRNGSIGVLQDGNVVVCSDVDVDGVDDVGILLVSPNGVVVSSNRYSAQDNEWTSMLQVLPDGTTVVEFNSQSAVTVYGQLKLDSAGSVVEYVDKVIGVTGPAGSTWQHGSAGSARKLVKSGADGQQAWVRLFDPSADIESVREVVVDGAANSYITGSIVLPDSYTAYYLRVDTSGNLTGSLMFDMPGDSATLAIDSRGGLIASLYSDSAVGDLQPFSPTSFAEGTTEPLVFTNHDYTTTPIIAQWVDLAGTGGYRTAVLDTGGGDEYDMVIVKRDELAW